MSPQEKAKELFGKHYIVCQEYTEEIQCSIQAKQCALIAVHEILQITARDDYWKNVKHEIVKL
jgi:ferritin-like protein